MFLGITFVYAGIQKLSDPGFLHPGAPTYIGTQLSAFAHGTPGGFLLRAFALPDPKLAGVAVAFVEIVVGLLVLGGLLTRVAAAVGLSLNLVLFLTNSWNTSPYFLGSDIVFVFAWLPFVLAGASGQPALDNKLDRLAADRQRQLIRSAGRRAPVAGEATLTRRGLVARAARGHRRARGGAERDLHPDGGQLPLERDTPRSACVDSTENQPSRWELASPQPQPGGTRPHHD